MHFAKSSALFFLRPKRFLFYLALLSLILPIIDVFPLLAQTSVSGTISANTVWTKEDSPYVVVGLSVSEGVTLTIEPGVVIKLESRNINVYGTLLANGTESEPVVFTSLKDDSYGGDTNGDGSATTPAKGDWDYLRFRTTSVNSVLNYVVVKYAGRLYDNHAIHTESSSLVVSNSLISNNRFDGVNISSADPEIRNCVISNNDTGIRLTDSNATITGNTVTNNNTPISLMDGISASATINDNTISDNTLDAIVLSGGILTENTLFRNNDVAYYASGGFSVSEGVTLTIEPGVVIKLSSININVYGTLLANGTESEPVVFTSLKDDSYGGDTNGDGSATTPAKGDWDYLRFRTTSVNSVLNYVVVKYAGRLYDNHAIHTESSSLVVSNSLISNNRFDGVNISSADPEIRNCVISNNDTGIRLTDSNATITGNTVTNNNTPISLMDGISASATINDNTISDNTLDAIVLSGGILTENTLFRNNDVAYYASGGFSVSEGVTLTIEPGVVIKLESRNINVYGTLLANGTESEPVVFTSLKDDSYGGDTNGDGSATTPAKGDWDYLRFRTTSVNSVLNYVVVKYAGRLYDNHAIHTESSSLVVSNSLISNNRFDGVNISSADPEIRNCVISNNDTGIRLTDSNATITGNTVTNNNTPISLMDGISASATINDNTISDNTLDAIVLSGGILTENTLFRNNDVAYYASGGFSVSEGVTLTIEPGVVIKLESRNINVYGTLLANGTESEPVVFTSLKDDSYGGDTNGDGSATTPAKGDWDYLRFRTTSVNSVLNYVVVKYAGRLYDNHAIHTDSSSLVVSNSLISNNLFAGIHIYSADPEIRDNVISNNDTGISLAASNAIITGNTVTNNSQYGIQNTTLTSNVRAENNYWGTSTGPLDISDDRLTGGDYNPLGGGNKTSNYVDYRPWLGYDPNIALSGFVSTGNGTGLNNVAITLTGAGIYTTSTLNGNYNFSSLPAGTYTVTPNLGAYQFDPTSRTVLVNPGTPLPPQNFSACTAGNTLSGHLINVDIKENLANTTFKIDGINVTTDSNGYYEVSGLSCGEHLFTVTVDGYFYDKNVSTFNNVNFDFKITRPSTVFGSEVNSGFGGDPVNTATGNYILSSKDLTIPGQGLPFEFNHFYNSQNQIDGPLGYGWGHNYQVFIIKDADGNATVHWGDGKTQTWTPDGTGGLSPQYGVFDNLIDNGNGTYTLTKKDQTSYHFNTRLHLASIVDKNGNTLALTYTGDNLTQIVDTVGRTVNLTYDASGRITMVTDPIARTLKFTYDANGNLVEAEDLNGNATQYTYDSLHQMLTAIDPKGNTFVTNIYDELNRVVTSQRDAKGGQTFYVYDTAANRTTITDPLGQTYYHYHDELKRLIQEQDALGFSNYFTYDEAGNRTKVTDKKGNQTLYAYDTVGNVTSKTNAMGLITTITYDTKNNPLTRTDPHHDTTSFTYDINGNLTKTTDPRSNATNVTYYANGLLKTQVDAKGNTTSYGYDPHGNLISITDPLNNVTAFTYDGVGRRLTSTDALGNTTTWTYDSNGNVLTEADALGKVTTHTYDANDKRISTTDRLNRTTSFTYDVKDLLTKVIDADGNQKQYQYDALDRKKAEIDQNGNTTSYSYDAVGNLLTTTDALGNVTTSTYDPNGNRLSLADPLSQTITNQYDAVNQLISATDAAGNQTFNEYDGLGRKVGVTDPKGNATSYMYDVVGNLVKTTNALGQSITYTYDANNNQLTASNPLAQTTTFQYDEVNRKTATIDPLGNTTNKGYNAIGQIITSTNAKGQVTEFEYDKLKRLVKVTDPAGGEMNYTYDANGNRLTMSDPKAQVTSYTYDVLNRRITQTEALGNVTLYRYDSVGNIVGITDPNGATTSYTYDAANRLTKTTYPDSLVSFTYDANNNRLTMVDSLGTTTYAYDTINRLTGVTDPFGKSVGYGYDASSNRIVINYPGGKAVNYSYDALNRLTILTDWLSNTTSYAYDAAGRITGATNSNSTNVSYTYDVASRLTGLLNQRSDASIIAGYSYTQDKIGNHVQVSENQPLTPVWNSTSTDNNYDSENRLVSQNTASITYDDNGNLIGQGSDIFAYDHQNRLISSQINGKTRQYAYNGLGNRYQVISEGVTKRVVWDINQKLPVILAETNGAGSITAYYVYGLGLVSKVLPDNTVYTYHYDSRGSTVALTDRNEAVANSYAFDGFGSVQSRTVNVYNPFVFLGAHGVVDDGNGLNYVRARYYNSEIKRFITKDPKNGVDENGQSWNRYSYGSNNPVKMIDASGLTARESETLEPVDIAESIFWKLARKGTTQIAIKGFEKFFEKIAINSRTVLSPTAMNAYRAWEVLQWAPAISSLVSFTLELTKEENDDLYWMDRWSRATFQMGASAAGSLVGIATGNPYAGIAASTFFSEFGYAGVEALGNKVGGILYDDFGLFNPNR